jgi:aspartyl-tRNA(Asn)/glutamyl-tRNA(Gln) amidotransferase subunit B
LVEKLGLSPYDAGVLTAERPVADYFERALAAGAPAKGAASWISSELLGRLHRDGLSIGESRVSPEGLAELLGLVSDGTISGKIAKEVFELQWQSGEPARAIVERRGLAQLSDAGAIEQACRKVVEANPDQVAKLRAGSDKLIGFFVGQVMKATGGKANPELVNQILRKLLS